ncbi:MAG: MgtC/SapB family protein [Gemmatimonadetes bacterium]|nr:MgtC/SapB family protein [Gemmatimonadota bacterium]NIR77579.1 MgtC/SapB family protein [Gemmatimonadota bacterium]NIT86131.1 MgtC/SapB family protein [Gemmatimonadota bacterium]NIU29948.1 MgtC/SapB family protein [Gemmatimonadota bacterium]NIU34917.1 MgtC/SapB family protein [Gemmatimonadota bacterium]
MEMTLRQLLGDLGLALAAFAFAFPIGWERHARGRPAGLRTFPIVALASCAFALLGQGAFPDDPGAQARILQGLMTGIGFIGGGAIVKEMSGEEREGTVTGIATAASIWNTGAIGAAVSYRRFEVAFVLSAVNFLILRYLKPVVERAPTAPEGEGGSD